MLPLSEKAPAAKDAPLVVVPGSIPVEPILKFSWSILSSLGLLGGAILFGEGAKLTGC